MASNQAVQRSQQFNVVVNDEEQYSFWSVHDPLPDGWHAAGFQGTKEECLAYIDEVWVDMRPKSLREQMDQVTERSSSCRE